MQIIGFIYLCCFIWYQFHIASISGTSYAFIAVCLLATYSTLWWKKCTDDRSIFFKKWPVMKKLFAWHDVIGVDTAWNIFTEMIAHILQKYPLSLTWIYLNPSLTYPVKCGWKYLSIPKLQRRNRWRFEWMSEVISSHTLPLKFWNG